MPFAPALNWKEVSQEKFTFLSAESGLGEEGVDVAPVAAAAKDRLTKLETAMSDIQASLSQLLHQQLNPGRDAVPSVARSVPASGNPKAKATPKVSFTGLDQTVVDSAFQNPTRRTTRRRTYSCSTWFWLRERRSWSSKRYREANESMFCASSTKGCQKGFAREFAGHKWAWKQRRVWICGRFKKERCSLEGVETMFAVQPRVSLQEHRGTSICLHLWGPWLIEDSELHCPCPLGMAGGGKDIQEGRSGVGGWWLLGFVQCVGGPPYNLFAAALELQHTALIDLSWIELLLSHVKDMDSYQEAKRRYHHPDTERPTPKVKPKAKQQKGAKGAGRGESQAAETAAE